MQKRSRTKPTKEKPKIEIKGEEVVLDSWLEFSVIEDLLINGQQFKYQPTPLYYTTEPKRSRYTPDIELPNGVLIEIKGYLRITDIQKHLLLKAQHPGVDLRFVFDNPNKKITGRKKLTYAEWCTKHGFLYAEKVVPIAWLLG